MNAPRYDHHITRKLADLLADRFYMPDDHMDKVILLQAIHDLWNAVDTAGWHTHTSDWDWRLHIECHDGSVFPDSEDVWADTFNLHFPSDDRFTACVHYDQVEYIDLEVWTNDMADEPEERHIKIAHIKTISYEQA